VPNLFLSSTKCQKGLDEKGKTPESYSNPFISQNASHRFSVIHNKHVISDRTVVLTDFEHLNLTTILSTSSLEHLVTIKKTYLSCAYTLLLLYSDISK